MLISESVLKWLMRFYPPLFFQRIIVSCFYPGFIGVKVKIRKSFITTNYNRTTFGGTIYSATDPFYPVMFYQIFIRKGYKIQAWSRSSSIRFLKPAKTALHFQIQITPDEIGACEADLNLNGTFRKSYLVQIYDDDEKLCASVINEIYILNLNYPETTISTA